MHTLTLKMWLIGLIDNIYRNERRAMLQIPLKQAKAADRILLINICKMLA